MVLLYQCRLHIEPHRQTTCQTPLALHIKSHYESRKKNQTPLGQHIKPHSDYNQTCTTVHSSKDYTSNPIRTTNMYQTSLRLHNVSNHTHNTCQTPLRLHIKSLSDYISNPTQTTYQMPSKTTYGIPLRLHIKSQITYQIPLRIYIKKVTAIDNRLSIAITLNFYFSEYVLWSQRDKNEI